jgi:hypothetical protein
MDEIPHLRTSERGAFKKCPMMWQWAWREGLTLRRSFPDARWFGTGIHLALAERYKYAGFRRGRNVLGVWRDYVNGEVVKIRAEANDETPEAEWYDAQELGEIMLGGYLDKYGKDERWYNVSVEQTFEVQIPYPAHDYFINNLDLPQYQPLVIYNGTFDGVRRDEENDGALWLWENKTAAQIRLTHLSLDDQAGSYWAIAPDWMNAQGIKFKGQMHGIMYDFLRKGKPDTDRTRDEQGRIRNKPTKQHYVAAINAAKLPGEEDVDEKFSLGLLAKMAEQDGLTVMGDISKVQGSPLFVREEVWRTAAERRTQIKRIQNEALHMEAMRTRQLPLYKSPGMNTCGGCDFKNMCELHEQNADWRDFRNEMYDVRDVYADHRKTADAST